MPLEKGSSQETVSKNIEELHTGNTYAHTKKKFGKKRANKQAVAIALSQARKSARGKVRHAVKHGMISEAAAKKHLSS